MSNDALILKYRPVKFGDVIGQDGVVRSFQKALDDDSSHAFIFTGPAGVGKTSLARIGAKYVGSTDANITELAAAIYNGVDDMRALTLTLSYRPLGKGSAKSIILDECHRVTTAGYDAILKDIEEPPAWAYWFLCTTDINKVPKTIRSRCSEYTLALVSTNIIFDHLEFVSESEKYNTPRPIIELCAKNADGSLRKALSLLAVCYAAKDRREAAYLLEGAEENESDVGIQLARALAKGASWTIVQPILQKLLPEDTKGEDLGGEKQAPEKRKESAEAIRHTVSAYFTKVLLGSKDEKAACHCLKVLDAFSEVCNPADGYSPIVIAVGRSLF